MTNKKFVEQLLIKKAQLASDLVLDSIEVPVDSINGDFSYPVFKLSKTLRKAPNIIAQDIVTKLQDEAFEKVVAVGGYVNFYLNKDQFVSEALKEINLADKTIGTGKNICIDYSSINIAKPMHIGHLSSTVIGGSLYRMYKYLGYGAIGINHLGDWGTQFGKLIYAYLHWGNKKDVEERGINCLLELYVKYHQVSETDPSIDDEARTWFLKIERGEPEAYELFTWFKDITLKEVGRVYKMLGIEFDSYNGESFYNDKIPPVVEELKAKGLLEESDGAQVVKLEGMETPVLILRSDGATLYATRDLATAKYRKATYDFYKSLYVVAYQQNLHFRQVFGVLGKMGYDWVKDCIHVQFGMVSLKGGGNLSSRKGNVEFLEKILLDAVAKAKETIQQKNPDLANMQRVSEMVGVGAIVFGALSSGRIKDIVFDIDKALEFEGETGPYIQYTHARCCSILQKSGMDVDASYVLDKKAKFIDVDTDTFELVKLLSRLDDTVAVALDKYEPSILARLMLDIAQAFNKFYITNHILSAEPDLKLARLQVVKLTQQVLKKGLELLLLQAPLEM